MRENTGATPGTRATSVTADPATKDVVVDASADVTCEAVIAAINTAGYREITVVEVVR